MTDRSTLKSRMDEIVDRHGEWSAMSIHLGDGLHTRGAGQYDDRLRRLLQLGADAVGRPLDQTRVVDLACLEGHYGIEFALHGAHALGIEGRESNLAKARFAAESLGLGDRMRLIQDDVLHLSREAHGGFEIVLCSGILYHIDAPDVFRFLQRIHDVCDRCAIFDTFVSVRDETSFTVDGRSYWGRYYQEHEAGASQQEKESDRWASIDNVRSFWFTKASLCNALTDVGFTSVLECLTPPMPGMLTDRITLLAFKGERARVLSSPATDERSCPPCEERAPLLLHPIQDPALLRRRKIGRMLPAPVKSVLKPLLNATGLMKFESGPFSRPRKS